MKKQKLQVSDLTYLKHVNVFCSSKDPSYSISAVVTKVGHDDIEFYNARSGVTTHVMPQSIKRGSVVVTAR
jgi:hypothetical protein